MAKFLKTHTKLEGLLVIEPTLFEDDRGSFSEVYNKKVFADLGLDIEFVQDNHSISRKCVLRGLHFQRTKPQAKLVRAVVGEVYDVAVDLRLASSTYEGYYGLRLSAENRKMLYVPPGFAHGFLVLSDWAEFSYKTSEYYYPSLDVGIVWDDPDIGVDWPLKRCFGEPILSDRDRALPRLKEIDPPFMPQPAEHTRNSTKS
jgi:dTDP-4-dehydrorhamnose 3,5-epimerase